MDGVPGHQLQITNEDQSRTFVAIHQLDRLLYILEGTVPEDSIPPIHFQQSLGFLDEQGKRVSVEYDEQGQRTRVETSYEWIGTEDPETGEVLSE
jgi:YD repeat-containing protein